MVSRKVIPAVQLLRVWHCWGLRRWALGTDISVFGVMGTSISGAEEVPSKALVDHREVDTLTWEKPKIETTSQQRAVSPRTHKGTSKGSQNTG